MTTPVSDARRNPSASIQVSSFSHKHHLATQTPVASPAAPPQNLSSMEKIEEFELVPGVTKETTRWLFIDCQTTGMRPSSGELLEIAWCWHDEIPSELLQKMPILLKSRLLQTEALELPRRISQITGIQNHDLATGFNSIEVLSELRGDVARLEADGSQVICVIHHSPFEIPFLKIFFALDGGEIPFRILDSSKIAKRLLPRLPSCNLRALAGHFGQPLQDLKRAREHASATAEIWLQLLSELEVLQIRSFESIEIWLKTKPSRKKAEPKKRVTYEYSIGKEFRLGLPTDPGIYRMIAGNGRVLYVGKATSLRSRVNSYFRGQKGRDPKKLEMLTQVKNIEVTKTRGPLEAAVLENEEIKRHNPPYNVSLKVGFRSLLFYDREFNTCSKIHSAENSFGPYRPYDGVDRLKLLAAHCLGRELGEFPNLFFVPTPTEDLLAAFENFCVSFRFGSEQFANFRSVLAWSFWLARRLGTSLDEKEEDDGVDGFRDEAPEVGEAETLEELTERFARLFLSATRAHRQVFELNRLINCRVRWTDQAGEIGSLKLTSGQYDFARTECEQSVGQLPADSSLLHDLRTRAIHPWRANGILVLDRLNVLRAELRKQASVKIERDNRDIIGNRSLHSEQVGLNEHRI